MTATPLERLTAILARENSVLDPEDAGNLAEVILQEMPEIDIHSHRADIEGISRVEAKTRNLRDMYNGWFTCARGTLTDQLDTTDRTVDVRVSIDNQVLFIRPNGYGDSCSMDGRGCPVVIEIADGELRIVVWGDINSEEYTHIISLEGAREDRRVEDGD